MEKKFEIAQEVFLPEYRRITKKRVEKIEITSNGTGYVLSGSSRYAINAESIFATEEEVRQFMIKRATEEYEKDIEEIKKIAAQ